VAMLFQLSQLFEPTLWAGAVWTVPMV